MLSKGDIVDHFEIIHLLGEGGMGQVYLAKDSVLERNVAIKFLPTEVESDPQTRMRFVREAKSAAALDHPFICKVYETGEVEEKAFIVMEYVEGKTLKDKMEEDPLSVVEALRITLEIAEALDEAHKKGIVHRDLKPANIMITPQNHVKVMDFGLAKRVLPRGQENIAATMTQSSITEQGSIAGTIAYMSPEQARGEEVDARSDIFSLGIILQEMISGDHPFSKPSAIETLSSILKDPAPKTQVSPKSINSYLAPILHNALAKERADRYQSTEDFITDVRNLQKEITGEGGFSIRRWKIVAATAVVVAIVLTGIWWLTRRPAAPAIDVVPELVSVLVADFENSTGDPIFDDTLEKSLSIGLESASFIDIYKRTNARNVAERVDPNINGRLDTQTAQLVSLREKINVVIDGSIELSEKGYTIKVRALDPVESKTLAEISESVKTKEDWFKAMAKLASEVRSKLGGLPKESTQELSKETFTTTSLEAMKAYVYAQELNRLGKRDEAIEEYLSAIEKDENFGRAYSGLALVFINRGQEEEGEAYFQKAMAQIDRMSEREKYRTRGVYYLINRNTQKAIEEYSALVENFPADSAGQTNLALAYFWAHDFIRAVEVGRQAVERQPENIIPRYNLVWSAMAIGDFDLAVQEAQKVLEINPDYDEVYVCLALSELAQERPEQAAEIYNQLRPINRMAESLALLGLADLALYEGRVAEAKRLLEEGIALDLEEGQDGYAAYKRAILAQTYLLLGDRGSALAAADRAVKESQNLCLQYFVAQTYISAGRVERARNMAADFSNQLQPEPRACGLLIAGEVKMAGKEIPEAIELLQQAQGLLETWIGHFSLGRAYLEAEAYAEAHAELEWCLIHHGEATSLFFDDFPSYRYFSPVYYFLGLAQEGLGSPASAESFRKFLEIKEKADSQEPLVDDARNRLGIE